MNPRARPAAAAPASLTPRTFFRGLKWLDGTPLLPHIEAYRLQLFDRFFVERDEHGAPRYNLGLFGRAKKNWKTADLVLAALFALVSESPAGHDAACYIIANDGDQARDDLALGKKIVKANPVLQDRVRVKRDVIERIDERGFLEILPAGDVVGQHGKSYRFVGYDEVHAFRSWDIFEAMQPDPHRLDAQQWITSYASLFHKPGAPLFDLMATGKAGTDPRMLFSWYGADYTTDPDCAEQPPEVRANPSMSGWGNPGYLAQQQRRLPSHKYRRLHLNLPGLPEGSAFAPEPVMDAIARGITVRPPEAGVAYEAFVDMSGGSADDAVLAIGYRDTDGGRVLAVVMNQGASAPFDPNAAVPRFARTLHAYRVANVTGDAYAGETFRRQFEQQGIGYTVCEQTKSELYEALEPVLNSHQAVLLDVPQLEQQLLGLVWRGTRIDHPSGEHDDFANAAAGVLAVLADAGLPALPPQSECYRSVSIGAYVPCYVFTDAPGAYIPMGDASCTACPAHREVMRLWASFDGPSYDLRTFRRVACGDSAFTKTMKDRAVRGLANSWFEATF